MVKVWAKHANCSVFGCTDEHRTLFRDPASEETREQWIYWFIYCMLLPHRSKIIMRFISQLFTFTYITDCFCNSCVFNVNLWVNENIVYSHAVTAAFCPCASDVCTQKTVYQKFKLIWFKNTWFQRDKHDNQNQNRCFLAGMSWNGAALFWKGGGSSSSFGFKDTGMKIRVFLLPLKMI